MRLTFDPPETGWTASLGADIVADPTAPSPPNVLKFTLGHSGAQGGTIRRTLSGLTVGQTYPIWLWVNFDQDMDPTQAQIRILYSNGIVGAFYRNPNVPGDPISDVGWELRRLVDPNAAHGGDLLYHAADRTFSIEQWGAESESGSVFIDTIYIGEEPPTVEEMTKRREIREALVTRLGTVTTGNGYAVTLGEVVTGPQRLESISAFPSVTLMHGEEAKAIFATARKKSTLTFYIGVACKRTDTADPDDLCDDACGEVEKAIEIGPNDTGTTPAPNGMFLGLGYVTNVFVVGVDPEELTPEVARDMAAWVMTVEITYTHNHRQP